MQPSHCDFLGQVPPEAPIAGQMIQDVHQIPQPFPRAVPRRPEDSWIEVSSQPSSSSLSSAATNDDIVTTGLRVQRSDAGPFQHCSRRRRFQHFAGTARIDYSPMETSSSQDEYEESESESDRVLSSSNEDMSRQHPEIRLALQNDLPASMPDTAVLSDDDDASTALGMRISSSPFVPQPNAFSHPPISQDPSWAGVTGPHPLPPSMLPSSSARTTTRRSSATNVRLARRQQQHSPYSMISPSHHTDHDAALRASLSTLLSCAAAARGLPKSDSERPSEIRSAGPSSTFRLVSESVVMSEDGKEECQAKNETSSSTTVGHPTISARAGPYRAATTTSGPGGKRRSSSSKDRCYQRTTASKRSRRASVVESSSTTSPTIMTWVISAGVVVLFSAISFSAGYILGREVGRMEASSGIGSVFGDSDTGIKAGGGRETVRGSLKRLRWSSAATGSGIMS